MSAIHAQTAPVRDPRNARRLRPAPKAVDRAKPSLGYAVIAVVTFLAIIAAQLVMSVGIAQGAYELDSLRAEHADLDRRSQTLQEDLERVRSPQFLAANAEALGMVPNSAPVYLRLSDGAVLGEPAPAGAVGAPGVDVSNALIDGVPLVTAEGARDAGKPAGGAEAPASGAVDGGTGAAAGAGAAEEGPADGTGAGTGAEEPQAPVAPDGLPTPATH